MSTSTRPTWAASGPVPQRATVIIDTLGELAASLVGTGPNAPVLACDACLRDCDTHQHAHNDAEAAIAEFLAHCAFDHIGPAHVLVTIRTAIIRLTRTCNARHTAVTHGDGRPVICTLAAGHIGQHGDHSDGSGSSVHWEA